MQKRVHSGNTIKRGIRLFLSPFITHSYSKGKSTALEWA